MKAYKNLKMWKAGNEMVLGVYRISEEFPKSEMYGVTSQLRRASLSVVLNIIEGYGRRTDGHLKRFLDIALGSLSETEYLLELCLELGYISGKDYSRIESLRDKCGKLLWTYRSKLRK